MLLIEIGCFQPSTKSSAVVKKNHLGLVILTVILIFCLPLSAAAAYSETFSSGTGGFHYGYGASYTDGQVDWSPTGGNPSGHISGLAANLYAIWVYDTDINGSFGDLRGGITLSVDTMITGPVSGQAKFYVGRAGEYFISTSSFDLALDTKWTTHSIVLEDANFTPWGGATDFQHILEAPDDIGIFFNGLLASGTGQVLVDNFGAPPPIPTLNEWGMILLLLLAGLFGLRRLSQSRQPTAMT